jgi:hypothetical protein
MTLVVALLTAGSGVTGPAAHAGDKIQFSAPSPLLEVPQIENETKLDAMTAPQPILQNHQAISDMAGAAPVIVIPLPKPANRFGWKPPFESDADEQDNGGLDLFAPKKPPTQNQSPITLNEENHDLSRGESWLRPGTASQRFGMSGLDADIAHDGQRPGAGIAEGGVSDWFQALSTRQKQAQEHAQSEMAPPPQQGRQLADSVDQSPFHEFAMPDPFRAFDPLHTSVNPARESANRANAEQRNLLDQPTQQTSMDPSMPRAWEVLPTADRPRPPAALQDAFSAPSHVHAAPAVLTFPKRPGDLFQ